MLCDAAMLADRSRSVVLVGGDNVAPAFGVTGDGQGRGLAAHTVQCTGGLSPGASHGGAIPMDGPVGPPCAPARRTRCSRSGGGPGWPVRGSNKRQQSPLNWRKMNVATRFVLGMGICVSGAHRRPLR